MALDVIKRHNGDVEICKYGYDALHKILECNHSTQEYACEKGCINALLDVLKDHADNESSCVLVMRVLGEIFSSPDLRSKYCTEEVMNAIRGCSEKHKNSSVFLLAYIWFVRKKNFIPTVPISSGDREIPLKKSKIDPPRK